MRRITLGLVGALALTLAVAGLVNPTSAGDKVRIGTEGAYPPFNLIDESGELKGFDVDIALALCDKMGAECELVAQDWDGIIPALLANKYDAIIASMSITDERKKSVDFTDKYYSNLVRYVAPKGSGLDTSSVGLAGKSIGAQRATVAASYLEDNLADVVSIKLYDTQENANLDLGNGRLDAMLADGLVIYDWLKTDEGAGFDFVGEGLSLDDGIGIAVRKEDTALRDNLNQALAAILADGTYEKINAKYFPFSIY